MVEEIVLGSGSVTKIELATPTEVKETNDYYGNKKTKVVPVRGAVPHICSTITLDKKFDISKDSKSFSLNKTLEFGKQYEIILRERDMTKDPDSGRAFREEEE